MRISDWSSDVCSSDLEVQAPADAAAVAVLRPPRHRRRGRGALHRLPGAAARRHAARAAVGRPVLAMAATAQPGDAGESLRQAAVHGWSDVGALLDQQLLGSPRSEEHTSELQSLMRISYAVFCLKKTNNNIHNRQSH